jgi:hypothetical protein
MEKWAEPRFGAPSPARFGAQEGVARRERGMMLDIIRIAAISGAVLLAGAASAQPADEIIPLPAANDPAAEALYLEELRRAANSPQIDPDSGSEDTISIVAERPGDVVCHWRRRNGSNFRERQCRARSQAEREELQAAHAMRRMRGF